MPYPVPEYDISDQNRKNLDALAWINKSNEFFSYSYDGNVTPAPIVAVNTAVPIPNPSTSVTELQVGTNFTSQVTSGYPEFTHNSATGLYECTFAFTVLGDDGEIKMLDVQIRENNLEISGWKSYLKGDGYICISATIFLTLNQNDVYSLWVENEQNGREAVFENFRITARPIPQQFT